MDYSQPCELLCRFLGMTKGDSRHQLASKLTDSQWDEILVCSESEHLSPLLYNALCGTTSEVPIPFSVRENLKKAYMQSGARNAIIYHSLAKVLKNLKNERIPLVVLKGAHLAELIYGNIALRPMGDVDLLVRREDLPLAIKILIDMGYTAKGYVGPDLDCSVHQHLPAFYKEGAATIEIHWTISHPNHPFQIDVAGLWERAQNITISGIELLGLSPLDLLLYSCIHATYQHRFEMAIMSLADISEILKRYENDLDWERLLLLAQNWKASRCVYIMLTFARQLFNAEVSEDVLQALEPLDIDNNIMAQFRARILEGAGGSPRPSRGLSKFHRADRLHDKLMAILQSIFISPKRIAWIYPAAPKSKKLYCYYLVHLKDVFLRNRSAALDLLFGRGKMAETIEQQSEEDGLIEWLAR